jgi:hypothetical protein
MDVEIIENEGEYLIQVSTDEKVALVVYSDSGERIYLPGESDDLTYYEGSPEYLDKKSGVWSVEHHEKPDSIEVIS